MYALDLLMVRSAPAELDGVISTRPGALKAFFFDARL
jgi:hypothetical protein